jgi:DNA replication regulator DPB11
VVFRGQLQERIIAHGGDYRGDLTKNVTHLIANAPEGKKYQYAEQWQVRVVSLSWFKDCLDRGMVLEESLYHPTIPAAEQGKGAWNREAKPHVQLGKRARDEKPPQEAPRKLRRTASTKLGSQSDDLWGDIMGGGFDTRPSPDLQARPSKLYPPVKPVVLEPESFVARDSEGNKESEIPNATVQRPANTLSEVYHGYFSDQVFFIHGFPPKNVSFRVRQGNVLTYTDRGGQKSKLRSVLKDDGALLVDSLAGLAKLPDMVRGSFVIVPYNIPGTDIPSVEAVHPTPRVVTDMWIERCLAAKAYIDPDEHPVCRPVGKFPIDGFRDLTINSTGFEGIELLHLSKLVKLVGGTYDETLRPSISVLICNKPKANPEKQRYAHSWGIPVVSDAFLWACLQNGQLESFDAYRLPVFPQGEKDVEKIAQEKRTERQWREGAKEGEEARREQRRGQLVEGQYNEPTMPAQVVVMSKQRKDPEPRHDRPGADFHEDLSLLSAQGSEGCGRGTRPDRQDTENKQSSSTAELDPDPYWDKTLSLQEIATNSPPRPASSPKKNKKPLFRSFGGDGSLLGTGTNYDTAPAAPAPTSTGKTEYVPPQTDSINEAIHDLLNMTAKARGPTPSITEGATKKTRLLGRALSNISNSSRQSRASSVDSVNTDGVGSAIGAEPSQSGKPRGLERSGSFTGKATAKTNLVNGPPIDPADRSLCRDEFADADPTPPMTQLGYGEHEDAVKIREKLAEKRRRRSRQGQESTPVVIEEKRIKDDDAILGTGWGVGRRTRQRERSPKGMAAF